MPVAQFTSAEWLALLQHELLLLAAVFFAFGLIDELAVDLTYAWLRLTGRAKPVEVSGRGYAVQNLSGMAAVFIPAWEEDAVIGPTLTHALASWPQDPTARRAQRCWRVKQTPGAQSQPGTGPPPPPQE